MTEREKLPVAAALEQVRAQVLACQRCDLWQTRTQAVFGTGNPRAALMLVGEAPGEQEDRQGLPFVGPAGRLLDRLLAQAGLLRTEIWLTNVVKSRPVAVDGARVKNRAPRVGEIKACADWLDQEIALIRPRVILCLGATAAKRLIRKDFRLTEERGTFSDVGGIQIGASLHPAYIFRLEGDAYDDARDALLSDLASARALAERLGLDRLSAENTT